MNEPSWVECFENSKGYCTYCETDLLSSYSLWMSAERDHVIARCTKDSNYTDELEHHICAQLKKEKNTRLKHAQLE